MRKLKEREAGINQCLKGRMKVRVLKVTCSAIKTWEYNVL